MCIIHITMDAGAMPCQAEEERLFDVETENREPSGRIVRRCRRSAGKGTEEPSQSDRLRRGGAQPDRVLRRMYEWRVERVLGPFAHSDRPATRQARGTEARRTPRGRGR